MASGKCADYGPVRGDYTAVDNVELVSKVDEAKKDLVEMGKKELRVSAEDRPATVLGQEQRFTLEVICARTSSSMRPTRRKTASREPPS